MQKTGSHQEELLSKRRGDMLLNTAEKNLKDKSESAENIQDKSKKIPKSQMPTSFEIGD